MASARVEHLLKEIGRLSSEEQADLARNLPRVFQQGGAVSGSLVPDAVRRAVETRERIRRRLTAAGQRLESITDDLDAIREGVPESGPLDRSQDQAR